MQTVLIVIHLMIVIALVAVVLLQRSEGGALGVGGGSGFMTGRGQANVLTRATAILGTLFFITSITLTLLANYGHSNKSILEGIIPAGTSQQAPGLPPKGQGTVLDQLKQLEDQRANPSSGTTPATQAPPSSATPSSSTSGPSNATAVPKSAPVEPTGVPSKPAAEAPSAPVQTAPAPASK
jgi:preprotein translocase subunit SecG